MFWWDTSFRVNIWIIKIKILSLHFFCTIICLMSHVTSDRFEFQAQEPSYICMVVKFGSFEQACNDVKSYLARDPCNYKARGQK